MASRCLLVCHERAESPPGTEQRPRAELNLAATIDLADQVVHRLTPHPADP